MQSRLYCAEVGVLPFPNQRTGGVSVVGCAYCYTNNSACVWGRGGGGAGGGGGARRWG